MDIQIACNLLDIDDLTRGNYTNLTYDYVKRKYHKMALKWHPDKNGNTVEATERFQKINEAYTYLITELELTNDNDNEEIQTAVKAGVDVILEVDFTNKDYKKVDFNINGNIMPIDTYSISVYRTITPYVREGINSIVIQPRKDVNIAQLKIVVE